MVTGDPSPDGQGVLEIVRGIEVGHIFQLRTKYAEALDCTFLNEQGKTEVMAKLGLPLSLLPAIGTVEILVTILYLIPRTSFLGAILVTGYLGGAILTHLRVSDPWYFPIIIGVIAWLGLALRQPLIFQLLFRGMSKSPGTVQNGEVK